MAKTIDISEPTEAVKPGLAVANAPAYKNPVDAILNGEIVLTPAQVEKAKELAAKLNMKDSNQILSFGGEAQAKLTQTAEGLIGHVRNKDTGAVGLALGHLVQEVKGVDPDSLQHKHGLLGKLIAKVSNPVVNFVQRYEKSAKQIDGIVATLTSQKLDLSQDITALDNMFADSAQQFKDLSVYVMAGKLKIQQEDAEIEVLRQQGTEDQLSAHTLKDKVEQRDLLERKVSDLETTRMITLQSLPQIRMIQSTDRILLQKIDSSIMTTIPVWKTQVALSISLTKQETAIAMQNALNKATEDMLLDNATLLKKNTVESRKSLEKGIVGIDTLKKVSETLISAVNESLDITQQAKLQRAETSKSMLTLEKGLSAALSRSANYAALPAGKAKTLAIEAEPEEIEIN